MSWNRLVLALAVALTGCARSEVTPISKNQFLLSTRAAPVCGRTGAVRVAAKMAAVETIRRGYRRFVILGASSDSDVHTITTGPTFATTTGTYNTYGNTTYGNATTTFGGNNTFLVGSNNADLRVLMLNQGDSGYDQGIDAVHELGEKWQELVKEGITTCER